MVHLNEVEETRKQGFLESLDYDSMGDLEETCEGSKSYYFEVRPTGIGDVIILHYKGQTCDITDYDSF